jgi:hypothetical protein
MKKEKKARDARMKKTGQVRVPEDCKMLDEAVKMVHGDGLLTTIVLGKGKHVVAAYNRTSKRNRHDLEIVSAGV